MATTRAAIYVRISQDRTGEGLGVARQEADCRALCDRLDWTVVDVYPDDDTSGLRGMMIGAPIGAVIGAVVGYRLTK